MLIVRDWVSFVPVDSVRRGALGVGGGSASVI